MNRVWQLGGEVTCGCSVEGPGRGDGLVARRQVVVEQRVLAGLVVTDDLVDGVRRRVRSELQIGAVARQLDEVGQGVERSFVTQLSEHPGVGDERVVDLVAAALPQPRPEGRSRGVPRLEEGLDPRNHTALQDIDARREPIPVLLHERPGLDALHLGHRR